MKRPLYRAIINLGNLAFETGRFDEARSLLAEGETGMRVTGDQYALARLLHTLALLDQADADWAAAERHLAESIALKQQLGDIQGEANSHNLLAQVWMALGRSDDALRLMERVLERTRTTGEAFAFAMYRDTVAMGLVLQGRMTEASDMFQALEADPIVIQSPRLHDSVRLHVSVLWMALGDGARAAAQIAEPLHSSDADLQAERQIVQAALAHCVGHSDALFQLQAAHTACGAAGYQYLTLVAERLMALPNLAPSEYPSVLWANGAKYHHLF
jgi:tetratricopeptide (TPR) repeat protein